MNRLFNFIKTVLFVTTSIISFVFAFVPESVFTYGFVNVDWANETIIICNRLLWFLALALFIAWGYALYYKLRTSVTIKGKNYKIRVEYGDLFAKNDCLKVINFDECFTTHVGTDPAEIKAGSVCGQFLLKHPNENFEEIVKNSNLTKARKQSLYQKKERYESGSIIPYNDCLLLAFAKLDSSGCGIMTRKEFLDCLELMWDEIDKYYATMSVAIPILGSNITRFKDGYLTQQELLDMMIASYKLNPNKLHLPAELHFVCQRKDDFSLNKIGEYVK